MLFNTQHFLLIFLPLVLGGYYVAARYESTLGRNTRKWLLIFGSLWFYGYWDYRLLPLLVFSILANWTFSRTYRINRRYIVALGVVLNLILLGIFKYADFFADSIAFLVGSTREHWNIILPLAISFFTFQQISYLADLRRGKAPVYSLLDYALYVSFFPQLIAGPIVRHHEIIGQFSLSPFREGLAERLSRGMTMLVIGLIKKVFLADPLGHIANQYFQAAADGSVLTFAENWVAGLAFTFQLYFDFSSYSDMAIGMGLLFGFQLPLNFNSPYRATSIRDFWRRWHMTLTRFMRDYVYVPIAQQLPRRYGTLRDTVATIVTMSLVGAWHGAAWSYVVFGAAHGAALVVNQLWLRRGIQMGAGVGWFLTFMFVVLSVVLFRSEDLVVSGQMWWSMFGAGGLDLAVRHLDLNDGLRIPVAALVAFLAPNSQTLALERLNPRKWEALLAGVALVAVLLQAGAGQNIEFIYFRF